jgi:adenosylcobinamide-phosphate synthase
VTFVLPSSHAFLLAVILDLLLGDPRWLPHPVRGIGYLAAGAEKLWRATGVPLRTAGALFWLTVVALTCLVVAITSNYLSWYWMWMFLALRSLDSESWAVVRQLQRSDLGAARASLAMIVGRDTDKLAEPEVLRATLETVSENLSDAVIAPLFYLALGGPVLMAAYKATNTLDSIVGYKNEKYRSFGWFSARMDDVVNLIPARLSAVLVWIAALLLGLNARSAFRITLRDGGSQPRPNSGYPEAAFAGALGVQLGGVNHYAGHASHKALLGDPRQPLSVQVLQKSRQLLYLSSFLFMPAVWMALRWR